MSWEPPALTTLTPTLVRTAVIAPVLSILALCVYSGSPQAIYQKALDAFTCASSLLADPRRLFQHLYSLAYDRLLDLHVVLTQHFKMVLTLGAVVWLLNRSWQTLWKPVPDLINVLGVDVPEAPDVSLAGIRADAATLSWTRPSSNRPVHKYSILVNGVHVGDSPGNETAITVTGLKPSHYYNIRVVAVGLNNFRAGSPVVRLRTFGKDGKPQLGNSRLPTNFVDHESLHAGSVEESDDPDAPRHSIPSVEAAPVMDGNPPAPREPNGSVPGRRNTINRRHSPSVASMDQPYVRIPVHDGPELSLDELNRKFEEIRKETEETLSLYAKDEAESQQQEDELKKEKDRKRQLLKEKEEQTTQLKASVRTTMEQMRLAEKDRSKREQQLKDKESKKSKIRDNIVKFENEIERMKKERTGFEAQKTESKKERDCNAQKLDEKNDEFQENCAELEAELKDKGKQLQDLKEAREQLPGADDEQWIEDDIILRRDWDARRKELHNLLVSETKKGHQLDQHIRVLNGQLSVQSQSGLGFYDHAESSTADFVDSSAPTQPDKRLSHNSNTMSNTAQFQMAEASFPNTTYSPAGFFVPLGTGAFDHPDEQATHGALTDAEAEIKSQAGPMSPSMGQLLPSFLLQHNDGPESNSKESDEEFEIANTGEEDPQSPASSRMSFPFTSPYASSQNLAFPQYADHPDRANINSSPVASPASSHRFATSLFHPFQRHRGPKATDTATGPPIGSLKPGQSQSFPRGADEGDLLGNKRRLSFSWMNRNNPGTDDTSENLATSRAFTRRLNIFGNSNVFSDRNRDNSRPVSIASTDLPRPSTDSNSIWGPSDGGPGLSKYRAWTGGEGQWTSRNVSRRPSLHGSPAAMTTTLASEDDEILHETDLLDPQTSPSQVGVIGSRPPGAAKAAANRLNPTAPLFINSFFRKDKDGDKEGATAGDKVKGKDRAKERTRDAKAKGRDASSSSAELQTPTLDDSPSDSRMSRDTYSVHTLNSVSESHDSLILDSSHSNTLSELTTGSASNLKDPDNVVKKLFRKGSSSKFSLSSRLGKDSSLFKKGPGSMTNSDKTMSADHRSSIGDLDDLGEDVTPLSHSHDSVTSGSSHAPLKSKDTKEGRMSTWRFSVKKKGKEALVKEKDGLDVDKTAEDE